MLSSCHKLRTAASGRKDGEPQITAIYTIVKIAYDTVTPFELAVTTEVFGLERPELGVDWYHFLSALSS